MGNTAAIVIGGLVIIVLCLGGYSVMVTREAAANAQRVEDQKLEIARLAAELQIKARQIAASEETLKRFKADQVVMRSAHAAETRKLKGTIAELTVSTQSLTSALASRREASNRLKAEIRRQNDALNRLTSDRRADKARESKLQSTIDRLNKELAANEIIIVELKNDRESIACLERHVPDVVLDTLLGDGVRAQQDNGHRTHPHTP
jgi:chromosome segregation ATPase